MAALPPPAALLPHTPPMILIDEVTEFVPEQRVACRLTLREDSTFVEDGGVTGLVCIEYMAQAIGAYVGLTRLSRGRPIRIGFLLGTREMSIAVDRFEVGDELTLTAEHVFGDQMLGSFKCRVLRGDTEAASALINVFQSEDEEVPNA